MGKLYHMKPIQEIIRERNIQLDTLDPVARRGFTQVPNFILEDPDLSMGAKITYAMFLRYAWHNDSCFPGQDRLANDLGMSRPRVTHFVSELQQAGLVTVHRRGLGKTNIYMVHFQVKPKQASAQPTGQMFAGKHPEVHQPTFSRQRANLSL